MRRVLVTFVMAGVVGLSALAGEASAVDYPASCKGILVTGGIGQPGAVADATHEFTAIAKALGLPPGVFINGETAHLHEADFQACLDALGF